MAGQFLATGMHNESVRNLLERGSGPEESVKITVLTPNFSDNCLGRAYVLAKVLMRKFNVEIVGPAFSGSIWFPCASEEMEYKPVRALNSPAFVRDAAKILKHVTGEVVYAVKPLLPSFGVGLAAKVLGKIPLILDIDDWEVGTYRGRNRLRLFYRLFSDLVKPMYSYPYAMVAERLIGFADKVTVSTGFLARKFGGVVVPHGRNTEDFDPEKYDRAELRKEMGLNGKKVVMFLGSPREHKGIEELIQAIRMIRRKDIELVVVGCDFSEPYSRAIAARGKGLVKLVGMVPFAEVPRYLSVADVVVVPQRRDSFSEAQLPAKIFDAMSMAKAIVSTRVSDIPEILNGAGLIVEPNDARQIADAVSLLIENEELNRSLGQKAREKCVREYSWDRMEESLLTVFGELGQVPGRE